MHQRDFNTDRGSGTGYGTQGKDRGTHGGTKPGAGPEGYCVCPSCGEKLPHKRGVPCLSIKCPKCDTPMERE